MTKIKNIYGFPAEKEITPNGCACGLRIDCTCETYNQIRKEIGELDITLDIEKIKELLLSPNLDVLIKFDENVAEIIATALAEGDILK